MAHQWKVIKSNAETLENALNQLDQDGYAIHNVLSAGQTATWPSSWSSHRRSASASEPWETARLNRQRLGMPAMALLGRRSVMSEDVKESSATRRQAAKDLKAAEALQIAARDDLAKGRASVSRRRVAIERGRATLARPRQSRQPDRELTPIYTNFEAAEADLDAAEEKLNAAAARIEFAERRLNEAREKAPERGPLRPTGRPASLSAPRTPHMRWRPRVGLHEHSAHGILGHGKEDDVERQAPRRPDPRSYPPRRSLTCPASFALDCVAPALSERPRHRPSTPGLQWGPGCPGDARAPRAHGPIPIRATLRVPIEDLDWTAAELSTALLALQEAAPR